MASTPIPEMNSNAGTNNAIGTTSTGFAVTGSSLTVRTQAALKHSSAHGVAGVWTVKNIELFPKERKRENTKKQELISRKNKDKEGRFDILSLSGPFLLSEIVGGQWSRNGGLRVSLAESDGRILGGSMAGGLIVAASKLVMDALFHKAEAPCGQRSSAADEPSQSCRF